MIKHLALLFEHPTGDYSKQLRPCLFDILLFQFEIVMEGNWAIKILCIFSVKKKINYFKASKIS